MLTDAQPATALSERPFDTIPAALAYWSSHRPDAVALADGDACLSFRELATSVASRAAGLANRGVATGDRVVLVGHNSIDWIVTYLAVLRLGAVVAPSNNRLNPTQFADQVDQLDAVLVLHDEDHFDLVEESRCRGRTVLSFHDIAAEDRSAANLPAVELQQSSPALISFTSGTTGKPKGAMLSIEALFKGSLAFADFLATNEFDSTLVLVPLFHNTGFVDQLGHMLIVGGRVNLLRKFRTRDAIDELAHRPVSFVTAVPSIIRLLMVADSADRALRDTRIVLFGGSPMPAAWIDELTRRWPKMRLAHGYGLSEFTSACSFLPHEYMTTRGESVGRAAPGARLRVVTDSGELATVGQIGEVEALGPTRMTEYVGQPALTASKLDGEWLRTGDLGYVDSDGLLWLTGRVDDVINRGGEKVLPAFVESCIAQLPNVSDSAVFGIPDPVLQTRVAAAVEMRPGTTFDETNARLQLKDMLPDYALPEFWFVQNELPRTASGKVDRRATADTLTHQENP